MSGQSQEKSGAGRTPGRCAEPGRLPPAGCPQSTNMRTGSPACRTHPHRHLMRFSSLGTTIARYERRSTAAPGPRPQAPPAGIPDPMRSPLMSTRNRLRAAAAVLVATACSALCTVLLASALVRLDRLLASDPPPLDFADRGLVVGDAAPDFDLAGATAGRYRLGAHAGHRPVLIEIGSFTSPACT